MPCRLIQTENGARLRRGRGLPTYPRRVPANSCCLVPARLERRQIGEAAERAGFELDPYSQNEINGLIADPIRPWDHGVVPIFTVRGGEKSVQRTDRDSNMPRAIPVIARAQLPGARQCRTASSGQFLGHADYFQETSNRPDVGHQG